MYKQSSQLYARKWTPRLWNWVSDRYGEAKERYKRNYIIRTDLYHVQLCDTVLLDAHRQRNSVFFDQHIVQGSVVQKALNLIVEYVKALYLVQAVNLGLTWKRKDSRRTATVLSAQVNTPTSAEPAGSHFEWRHYRSTNRWPQPHFRLGNSILPLTWKGIVWGISVVYFGWETKINAK